MPIDYFDHRILTGVIVKRPPKYSLITDLFFKPRPPQPTDKLELHIKSRGRQLLPFVREEEPGKVIKSGDAEAVIVKAPRIRVKTPYQAADVLKNPAGYTPYEIAVDPVGRAIVEDLDFLREDVDLTIEWMAAQIATKGTFTVSDKIEGKLKPIYTVDNRMPAAHKITVNEAQKWSAADSKIMESVEGWSTMIQDECGTAPTELVLGKNVWGHFFRHADVKDNLDNRRIDMGGLQPKVSTMFKGVWNGLNVWVYTGNVTGYGGKTEYLLDTNSILLGARDTESVIEYGLPMDRKCEGATSFFAKTYDEEDPSATWLLVESRPMPWARRPGAFLCAKVL